jgi:hypothetical protein
VENRREGTSWWSRRWKGHEIQSNRMNKDDRIDLLDSIDDCNECQREEKERNRLELSWVYFDDFDSNLLVCCWFSHQIIE